MRTAQLNILLALIFFFSFILCAVVPDEEEGEEEEDFMEEEEDEEEQILSAHSDALSSLQAGNLDEFESILESRGLLIQQAFSRDLADESFLFF